MAYVKRTLAPGEEYLYRARFNWTYDFVTLVWALIGAAPVVLWLSALGEVGNDVAALAPAYTGFVVAAIVLASVLVTTRLVHKWTTVIAVTTARLVLKTGLIGRKAHDVNLDKIEEVLLHQPPLQRILGCGGMTVRGTGVAVIEFPVLAKPKEIRREIERAILRARERRNGLTENGAAKKIATGAETAPH